MVERRLVHFSTTGPEADRRFVREYVLEAIDRLPERPWCEGVGFVPAGHKPGVDGLVLLEVLGDADAVVTHERDRWDDLVDRGLLTDWTLGDADRDPATHWGARGAALRARLDVLAARMSKLVFEEFDDPPDPVDAYPREASDRASPTGVGWWVLLHLLTLQQGYPYRTEVDAYAEGIRDALHKIELYEGEEAARGALDEVVASLEAVSDDLGGDSGGG